MGLFLMTFITLSGLSLNLEKDSVQLQNLTEAKAYLVETVKNTQGVQYDRLND